MNEICIVLYVNALYSQHLLNKPLTNRESNKLMLFPSQLFFSIVENLLRVYAVYYQYGYIIIHQFNKKRIVLQGFKLFPCDGAETAYPAVGIRRTQHGQEYIPELPESCVSKQCHFQYQRGLPQPVQFRLGRKTAHRGGRGIAQPQGGQRAVEEPQHHTFLQGGSQRQRP